ncbi:MAG: response regulator transcription factor [Deltaproteobacteria bacterium]|nr:response regulator transcription factor [Deltaproteobacteria bacterium]
MDKPIRVLIVDDHEVVANGIQRALDGEPDFECIGTVSDGLEALDAVKSLQPDMVTMDLSIPGLDGMDTAREIMAWDANIKICIFTMHAERAYAVNAFKALIPGYVLKEQPISELILALKAIRDGTTFYSEKVHRLINEHLQEMELGTDEDIRNIQNGINKLSKREKEVFILLADGLTPKEIGERLFISPKTVETHKYNILEKLGFHSMAELTKLAIKKELIDV